MNLFVHAKVTLLPRELSRRSDIQHPFNPRNLFSFLNP